MMNFKHKDMAHRYAFTAEYLCAVAKNLLNSILNANFITCS